MENFIGETLVKLFHFVIGIVIGFIMAALGQITGFWVLNSQNLAISLIVLLALTTAFYLGKSNALITYMLGVTVSAATLNYLIMVGFKVEAYFLLISGIVIMMFISLVAFRFRKPA